MIRFTDYSAFSEMLSVFGGNRFEIQGEETLAIAMLESLRI
jgi:hypothetical protein